MKFEWDERKRLANLHKHGFDFRRATELFAGDCFSYPSPRQNEDRWVTIGVAHGRLVAIVWTSGELSQRLGDRQWLDGGGFTAGDLLMVTVLRIVEGKGLVEQYDNLAAYMARGIARPGLKKALADQLSGFAETPPPEASAWMEKQQQGERS